MSFSLRLGQLSSHPAAAAQRLRRQIVRETRQASAEARRAQESDFQPHRRSPVELSPKALQARRDLTGHERHQLAHIQKSVPQAQRDDLNRLLVSGKLVNHEDEHGQTLLDHLARLAAPGTQLKYGMAPKALLGDLVAETAHPTTISQGNGNAFCGATAAAYGLASRNPAEYARLVRGLAQHGKVHLGGRVGEGGAVARVDPALIARASGTRSLCQRLLAQPLSAIGVGDGQRVDGRGRVHVLEPMQVGTKDGDPVTVGRSVQNGLFANQVADLQSSVSGGRFRPASLPPPSSPHYDNAQVAARNLLRHQVAHHAHPAVLVDHHWLSVSHIDRGQVTLVDEHGQTFTRPLDALVRHAAALTYDARFSTPPKALTYDARGGPGGHWNHASGTIPPGT